MGNSCQGKNHLCKTCRISQIDCDFLSQFCVYFWIGVPGMGFNVPPESWDAECSIKFVKMVLARMHQNIKQNYNYVANSILN